MVLLSLLSRHAWASPSHFGNDEQTLDRCSDNARALTMWADPVLWRNEQTRAEGSVWFGRGAAHSCFYLRNRAPLRNGDHHQRAWVELLADTCIALEADFGYLHLTTQSELAQNYAAAHAIDTGITTHDLRKGIPDLCWAMVFGPRYRVVSERFRNLTGLAELREIQATGHVVVELTESLFSIATDYEKFDAWRREVKARVGDDFLWHSGGSRTWAPEFAFDTA
jgi:hypothetical protein